MSCNSITPGAHESCHSAVTQLSLSCSKEALCCRRNLPIRPMEPHSTAFRYRELTCRSLSLVYADWCGPCKQIAPYYDQLSQSISEPKAITFVKINTGTQKSLAAEFAVTSIPTFILFRNGAVVEKVKGANLQGLQSLIEKLTSDVETSGAGGEGSGGSGSGSGSGGIAWKGADLPRGYTDISDVVEVRGLELLNADQNFSVRTLFSKSKPSALNKSPGTSTEKDWVESDTDEQLLLFAPFNSATKLHTIQVCSALRIPRL